MARPAQLPVLLVACPPWRTECPNLALAYLSAMLRANGCPTWVADFNIQIYNRIQPRLRRYWNLTTSSFWTRPDLLQTSFGTEALKLIEEFADELCGREGDLIGFSTQSANLMFTLELVRLLRRRGCRKTLIMGGPAVRLQTRGDARSLGLTGFQASGFDEAQAAREIREYLDLIDIFVEGEGEKPLLELTQRLSRGEEPDGTPGAVVWRHGNPAPFVEAPVTEDLDDFPAPTFEEFDLAAYTSRALPFLTSRGCVRKCAMCYERILWPGFRHRGIESIVTEMRHHLERWDVHEFSCNDLLLNGNLPFLGRLCDAVAASGLPVKWWGNAVVHRLMDPDLFRRMRAGGITALVYGIESGSQKVLRKMRKGYVIDDADNVLRWGKAAGINNVINIIVGFPGETEDDHRASLEFVRRNHDCVDQVGVLAMCTVYPHSPLSEQWEYYGIDPASLEQYNPYSINVDWRDTAGLDLHERQRRFWEMFRLIRGYGIDVVGVEEEEKLTPARVAELAQKLSSAETWEREDAIVRLAKARDRSLVPTMARCLKDRSFLVAAQALMNLAELDPDRAWKAAAPLLTRTLSYLDHAATVALAKRLDGPTLDLLEYRLGKRKYFRHNSVLQRVLAAHRKIFEAFERFQVRLDDGENRAVEELLAHPFDWVPLRGLRWLEQHRLDRAWEQQEGLQRGLTHPSLEVRLLAVRIMRLALLRLPPADLAHLVAVSDPRIRAEAARLLARQLQPGESAGFDAGDRALEALAAASRGDWPAAPDFEGEELEYRRLLALGALFDGARPEEKLPMLVQALHEGSPEVRRAALEVICQWQDFRYLDETIPLLEEASPAVRRKAVEVLGRSGQLRLQYKLLPLLDDPDLFVGQEATAALARLESPLMPERLSSFLRGVDPDELPDCMVEPIKVCLGMHSQAMSLAGAARAGDQDKLLDAWGRTNSMGRMFVLQMLSKTETVHLHPELLRIGMCDGEPEVRAACPLALLSVPGTGLAPDIMKLLQDPWPACRAAACRFLGTIRHEAARPAFLALLHDPDPNVREWAARSLGRLGNLEDLEALRDVLRMPKYGKLSEEARDDLDLFYKALYGPEERVRGPGFRMPLAGR